MKKSITFILALFFAASAFAQSQEHMKFMGIELNGTIAEFQKKLQAKGVKVSPKSSKTPNGMRLFEGVFSGEDAEIIVWYNPRSKQVFRAKAIIERYGEDLITQILDKMESKLDMKYGIDCKSSEIVKDDHLQEFKQVLYKTEYGTIGLFVVSTAYIPQSTFYLQVDYYDKENSATKILEEMDDL